MAAITASPTPFAASYNDPSRRPFPQRDLVRPASRPNLRRGLPLASSVNNPPIQHPFTFSMGDSSDDEMPVPPMKFSAEVKSLLGDEASVVEGPSPSQRKEELRGILRLDKPGRRQSPLALSDRFRERTSSPSSRNGSPRIVRLNAINDPPSTLTRNSSLRYQASPAPAQSHNFITPAPRPRATHEVPPASQSGPHSDGQNLSGQEYQSSAGSNQLAESSTSPKEHSSMQEAEVQMGNLSINRTTKTDDAGPHTGTRQRRVQLTGTFLRGGKARRGMKRRQSEEDPSPNHELPSSGNERLQQGESDLGDAHSERDGKALGHDLPREERPPHVRFQSQASVITGSPELRRHEPVKEPVKDSFSNKPDPPQKSTFSGSREGPVFKLPPMPLLPSRFDQENEPPPTFKRNKPGGGVLGERTHFAEDEKMLIQTPATVSPSRPPLAARSQNTPLRPAPPPPKMSVLETATAPAGAASASQNRKKRNFMSVNGKMFTRMDCIGRGGSSKVYRVMAENYKVFALKRVTLEDQDELAIRGYKGEIDLLRKLERVERVVRLFDFEINEEKHTLSVLMEMGESDLNRVLTHRLNSEDASFDITSTRYFWKEMLECVTSVHELNIVHSDLKPANFLLMQGRLKLIDFGISNAIADDTVNVHREQHIGTPNYMSPEALIDSNAAAGLPSTEGKMMKLGKPSDVWSLGCILYQMVYGKPPFAHIPNQMQRIMAIPNPRHVISFPETGIGGVAVPSGLLRTLRRCLNRDQTQRPTVEELLGPTDPFLNPDRVLDNAIPMGLDLITRLQSNIVRHIKEKGMPSEDDLRIWPDKFYKSIKAAVEDGRA